MMIECWGRYDGSWWSSAEVDVMSHDDRELRQDDHVEDDDRGGNGDEYVTKHDDDDDGDDVLGWLITVVVKM